MKGLSIQKTIFFHYQTFNARICNSSWIYSFFLLGVVCMNKLEMTIIYLLVLLRTAFCVAGSNDSKAVCNKY